MVTWQRPRSPTIRSLHAKPILLALLASAIFINYIDRGNLSIAAPMIRDELGLSASRLGALLSAFFWTYSCFQIVSGWLVDHFDVRWVLGLGFLLWSAATAATGILHTFIGLLLVRLLLGVGESVATPSFSTILAREFPEHRRGVANSVIAAAQACGPAFGTFAGGMLMARFGWRPIFIILGLGSMVWLWVWYYWRPQGETCTRDPWPSPRLALVLRQRSAWGTFVGTFCGNYVLYFLLTWLPFYLVQIWHFSIPTMAKLGGVAYLCMAASTAVCGWLSDHWIAAGDTPTRIRKTYVCLGQGVAGILLASCTIASPRIAVVLLILASTAHGAWASNLWAITQTLAGPRAAGKWTGLQNFSGNLAGVVGPAVAGILIDITGKFYWPFLITGAIAIAGVATWLTLVGPVEPVTWGKDLDKAKPADLLSSSS